MATKALIDLEFLTNEILTTDLLYVVRGTGAGRDMKVLGDRVVPTVLTQNISGNIDLDNYFGDIVVVCTPSSAITVTSSNTPPAGRSVCVVNKSVIDDITFNGEIIPAEKVLIGISDGSNLNYTPLDLDLLPTIIVKNVSGTIDLDGYTKDIVIFSTPASAITISTLNSLPIGKRLTQVNKSTTYSVTFNGEEVPPGKILDMISDGAVFVYTSVSTISNADIIISTGRTLNNKNGYEVIDEDGKIDIPLGETYNVNGVPLSKTDIGLSAVTNHAQLKRAAGDFVSFDPKTTPVGADIFLIEDSGDSNNKKKVALSAITSAVAGAVVEDSITDGVTDKAPSENAVFDALAGKETAGAAAAVLASSLQKASNLSDVQSQSTSRTNLGLGTGDTPTFADTFSSVMNRSEETCGADTLVPTGIPVGERLKFKIAVTYSGPNVVVNITFVSPYTSFSYYINGKKYTVTDLTPYTNKTATAAEGVWYVYINNSNVFTLSQTPWVLAAPSVLLWNFSFNSSDNTITWVGYEKHASGRDLHTHPRHHALGAAYGAGLLASSYNGLNLVTLATNDDNNFGRNQFQISNGYFYDEDLKNSITHKDTAITAITPDTADTDWGGTSYQFLGFTALNSSTTAGTITFGSDHTLITGQAITVMTGDTTTVRGTFTVTAGGTDTSFDLTTVTGSNAFANGDAVVVGARIPIYYISAVSGSVYTWRKLAATDFMGMTGTASPAPYNSTTITNTQASFNDPAVTGGNPGSLVTANRYFPVWLIAGNLTSEPEFAIMGQGQSTNSNLATAMTESPFQFENLLGLGNLNIQEVVPHYRLMYLYNTGGTFTDCRVRLRAATFINVRVATASGTVLGINPSPVTSNQVLTDTTNFNGVLTSSEVNTQLALDRIDDYATTPAGVSFFTSTVTAGSNVFLTQAPKAFIISNVKIAVLGAPTVSGSVSVDVTYHATNPALMTTIFTQTASGRPTLSYDSNPLTDTSDPPGVTAIAAGGFIGINIEDLTVGTGVWSGLSVTIVGSQ